MEKQHYKMYKDGKKWVFAAITVIALGVGLSESTYTVKADSNTDRTQNTEIPDIDTNLGNTTNAQSTENPTTDTNLGNTTNTQSMEEPTTDNSNNTNTQSAENTNTDTPSGNTDVSQIKTASADNVSSGQSARSVFATNNSAMAPKQLSTSKASIPSGGEVSDDITQNINDDLLSYAANFHIFANKATLNSHTNGNLAVGELVGKVNFGTNVHEGLVSEDLYYIGKLDSINASSFVSDQSGRTNKVVFGSGVSISIKDGQVYVDINGSDQRLDHLKDAEVYQDSDGNNYIDIQGILDKLSGNSTTLYTQNIDNKLISFDGQDQNSRTIDVSSLKTNDNNQIIVGIKASDLEKNTPITIKGINKNSGPIIFNIVDDNGKPITGTVNVNSQIKLIYKDGPTRSNHETEDFSDAHILWNFGQSSAANINAAFQGSVLAPKADIVVGQNLDGNKIGNSVTINAQCHRWDFQQGSSN